MENKMTAVETTRQTAITMLGYCSSDSAIIAYIKFKHGEEMTASELRRIKRDYMPSNAKLERQKKVEPISYKSDAIRIPDDDPLLRRLERYHPAIVAQERRKAAVISTARFWRL